jgi:hypothetical protein
MTWSRSSTRSGRSRFPAALMRHSPRAPTLCDRILRLRRTRNPAAVRSLLSSSHRQAIAKQRGLPFSMVGMFAMQDETRSQRYAIASLLCLVLAFGGGPASIIIADQVQSSLVRAICLLVGPSAFVLWIVTGVRSLHRLRLRYWQLASTYVAPCSPLAAAVGLVIASASQSGGTGRTQPHDGVRRCPDRRC